jgi:hypothetical protein
MARYAIVEDQGLTPVMTQAGATGPSRNTPTWPRASRCGSIRPLGETGLTAAVSRALTGTDLSCTVIAGAAQRHLFADWPRRYGALHLIGQL